MPIRPPLVDERVAASIAGDFEHSGRVLSAVGRGLTAGGVPTIIVAVAALVGVALGIYQGIYVAPIAGAAGTLSLLAGLPIWSTGARRLDLAKRILGRPIE